VSQTGGPCVLSTVLVLPAWYPTARQPLLGVFVREHARAAAGQGHRLVVVVDEGPSSRVRGLFTTAEERDGELRIVRLSYRRRAASAGYTLGVLALARRLAREGTPVDVIHAHVHRMGWAAALVGGLLRRPVVISEHSSEWTQRQITSAALRRARIAFRRAAVVCPVSIALENAIKSQGIHARFRVVPNAVDTKVFHPPVHLAGGPPTRLVNVALHREVKGLDVLLRAFAVLASRRAELTLVLVGEGIQTPDLQRLAVDLGLAERCHFVGAKEPEGVGETLRRSHVFVLASLSETLGVAVIEALCCGLPVAATDVGGVPEVLGPDDGVLAPPGDIDALAAAIKTVLDQYARFDRAAIARRSQGRFSLEAVGQAWDEIYQSLSG
jgi:glycosyltransferase involved in cell wall biosynthesis